MKSRFPVPCKPCEDIHEYNETSCSDNLYFLLSAVVGDGSIGIG
jgi:hypothetical protein